MKKILFTRKLTDEQKSYGASKNLKIMDVPFIDVKGIQLADNELAIINNPKWSSWIFTSQNAIKHFPLDYKSFIHKKIYCVGQKTYNELLNKGFKDIQPSKNSKDMLSRFTHFDINNILYFCGNLRADDMHNYFTMRQINYKELILYETKFLPKKIAVNDFDAVCFCSPSSVKSFFMKNSLNETPAICIGHTTANALKKGDSHSHIAGETTIESMIEKISATLK